MSCTPDATKHPGWSPFSPSVRYYYTLRGGAHQIAEAKSPRVPRVIRTRELQELLHTLATHVRMVHLPIQNGCEPTFESRLRQWLFLSDKHPESIPSWEVYWIEEANTVRFAVEHKKTTQTNARSSLVHMRVCGEQVEPDEAAPDLYGWSTCTIPVIRHGTNNPIVLRATFTCMQISQGETHRVSFPLKPGGGTEQIGSMCAVDPNCNCQPNHQFADGFTLVRIATKVAGNAAREQRIAAVCKLISDVWNREKKHILSVLRDTNQWSMHEFQLTRSEAFLTNRIQNKDTPRLRQLSSLFPIVNCLNFCIQKKKEREAFHKQLSYLCIAGNAELKSVGKCGCTKCGLPNAHGTCISTGKPNTDEWSACFRAFYQNASAGSKTFMTALGIRREQWKEVLKRSMLRSSVSTKHPRLKDGVFKFKALRKSMANSGICNEDLIKLHLNQLLELPQTRQAFDPEFLSLGVLKKKQDSQRAKNGRTLLAMLEKLRLSSTDGSPPDLVVLVQKKTKKSADADQFVLYCDSSVFHEKLTRKSVKSGFFLQPTYAVQNAQQPGKFKQFDHTSARTILRNESIFGNGDPQFEGTFREPEEFFLAKFDQFSDQLTTFDDIKEVQRKVMWHYRVFCWLKQQKHTMPEHYYDWISETGSLASSSSTGAAAAAAATNGTSVLGKRPRTAYV